MLTITGYRINKNIYESSNSLVYYSTRTADEQPAIIKVLQADYPTPEQVIQFHNEYELTKDLHINGVRRAIQTVKVENKYGLILEYVAGQTLKQTFQTFLPTQIPISADRSPLALTDFLTIAIQISQILGEIHQQHIIHKDINPNNILVTGDLSQATIIDFGISSKISLKIPHLGNPEQLEGTLAYISPEQTGRMNRQVDYRTDFYSLGVTFYELLTGQLPFESQDPLGLMHAHIAKQPISPADIKPNIPRPLSEIILKLMAKNAEQRYQSAFGLKWDLEYLAKQQPDLPEHAPTFSLGQYDYSGRFQIPQTLYGREEALETLLQAFARTGGAAENRGRRSFSASY